MFAGERDTASRSGILGAASLPEENNLAIYRPNLHVSQGLIPICCLIRIKVVIYTLDTAGD